MLKTFYVQKDEKNIVRDIIEFPYSDYIPMELNTPLPPTIMSGCYKVIGESIVYDEKLDTNLYELKKENLLLKTELTDTQLALAEIYEKMEARQNG